MTSASRTGSKFREALKPVTRALSRGVSLCETVSSAITNSLPSRGASRQSSQPFCNSRAIVAEDENEMPPTTVGMVT